MQSSDVKRRKKASDAKQNGEKRRPEEREEEENKRDEEESKKTQKSSDVTLVLSLMSLAGSVIVMWWVHTTVTFMIRIGFRVSLSLFCSHRILYQQNSSFTEIKEQYDDLYEKTRSVLELQSQMSSVSDKVSFIQTPHLTSLTSLTHSIHSFIHSQTDAVHAPEIKVQKSKTSSENMLDFLFSVQF